jgi:hypothetical protein
LLLALAVALLTTTSASAHWRCRQTYAVPMVGVGVGMMPAMPMMGLGVTPTLPMAGLGVTPTLPLAGLGVAPTLSTPLVTGGGASMSFSMQMSGDASVALVGIPLLRALLGSILGTSGTTGVDEARFRALVDEAKAIRADIQRIRDAINAERKKSGMDPLSNRESIIPPPSPEVEAARREIRQLVAEGAAARSAPSAREVEQARAEVRRLVSEGASGKATPSAQDVAQARAEIRRLLAEEKTKPAARTQSVSTTVANSAK